MLKKESYFQGGGGVNEPTPGKKKYKDEPIDQEDTVARGVLYKNYDLYEVEPKDLGPGAGFYQNMSDYKSVSDFRDQKKKRNERKSKIRKALFKSIELQASKKEDNNNIVDTTEGQVTPIPFAPAETTQIGLYDGMYPPEDLEDKPVTNLYYGRLETHLADDKKK